MTRTRDAEIGLLMKAMRTHKGLSLQRVGERMGMSRNAISLWEQGVTSVSLTKFITFCEIVEGDALSAVIYIRHRERQERNLTVPEGTRKKGNER